jgi:hypothetical protein
MTSVNKKAINITYRFLGYMAYKFVWFIFRQILIVCIVFITFVFAVITFNHLKK